MIGPKRDAINAAQSLGFKIREIWIGAYFDGMSATKRVDGHKIEIYAGNANDGEPGDNFYSPVVYFDDRKIANPDDVARALRVAQFREMMIRSALTA